MTDRVFSISAGLEASIVTPGRTAPVPSFTTPAIATCAWLVAGSNTTAAHNRAVQSTTRRMTVPSGVVTECRRARYGALRLPVKGENTRSDAQSILQFTRPVAGDGKFSFLFVLEAHHKAAVNAGKQLLHERHIDNGGAVNPGKPPRVEPLLELGQREIDDVIAAMGAREGELVLRDEMADPCGLENCCPLA